MHSFEGRLFLPHGKIQTKQKTLPQFLLRASTGFGSCFSQDCNTGMRILHVQKWKLFLCLICVLRGINARTQAGFCA